MTFEYFNTKFHHDRWKQKQPFTFWYCVNNFYPWKDIVRKKVSKLRSIAVPRAFYGNTYNFILYVLQLAMWVNLVIKLIKVVHDDLSYVTHSPLDEK